MISGRSSASRETRSNRSRSLESRRRRPGRVSDWSRSAEQQRVRVGGGQRSKPGPVAGQRHQRPEHRVMDDPHGGLRSLCSSAVERRVRRAGSRSSAARRRSARAAASRRWRPRGGTRARRRARRRLARRGRRAPLRAAPRARPRTWPRGRWRPPPPPGTRKRGSCRPSRRTDSAWFSTTAASGTLTSACRMACDQVPGGAGGQDQRDDRVHVLVRRDQLQALPEGFAGYRGGGVHRAGDRAVAGNQRAQLAAGQSRAAGARSGRGRRTRRRRALRRRRRWTRSRPCGRPGRAGWRAARRSRPARRGRARR